MKRRSRPCPLCKDNPLQSRLSRHILRVHRNDREVKDILKLDKRSRDKALDKLKKRGIYNYNKTTIKLGQNRKLQQERFHKRSDKSDMIICTVCKGCFCKKYFHRHKDSCGGRADKVPVAFLEENVYPISEDFKTILNRFHSDQIGDIIRSDRSILLVGQKLYDKMKKKQDKKMEVRKSVMTDMRRIASLYQHFCSEPGVQVQHKNAIDMFMRKNFRCFEQAIEKYTSDEGKTKAGLKNALYFLIQKMAKIILGAFWIEEDDAMAKEVENFQRVLEVHHDLIFGDAVYHLTQNRQKKLRRPDNLPDDEDVQKLRKYTIEAIKQEVENIQKEKNQHVSLTLLRDLAVCRLTLFNCRRGGEPARLLKSEWKDALNDAWVDSNRIEKLSPLDQELFSDMKIAYQGGKGLKLVPVLIPHDTVDALSLLCDEDLRKAAMIKSDNSFLFPTKLSDDHVNGWYAINEICIKAGVTDPSTITATKMRHRISTIYGSLELPESERVYFYEHMGHSKEMNLNVYQVPHAEAEIRKVGQYLKKIDKGI